MAYLRDLTSARKGFVITHHDTNEIGTPIRAIHVNVGGTAIVKFVDDEDTVPLVLVAGACYSYQLKQVLVTGTDAEVEIVGIPEIE